MKKNNKRLFLFAGYDPDNIIDDTLVHYLTALDKLGDIVLVMDCDINDVEKLKGIKNLLYIETKRHGEYDFGSYKRAYMWARNKKILNKYDWVYLVNDSVYGPLFDLTPCLKQLESSGADFTGLASYTDDFFPEHIQSYFVGLSNKVVKSNVLHDFMKTITKTDNKRKIIFKYEVGLSRTLLQNGFKMSSILNQNSKGNLAQNHIMYNNPKEVLEKFIPFIKKTALSKFDKSECLLPYTSEDNIKNIYNHTQRTNTDVSRQNIPEPIIIPTYKKIYRFTLFAIPIITVYKKQSGGMSYKIYVFDKIPVAKIVRN